MSTHSSKLQRIAQRGVAVDYVGEYQRRPELVTDFMARNSEHVTLHEPRDYRPQHAVRARFDYWRPVATYARVPLLGLDPEPAALPRFYDAATSHLAIGFLHTARGRFGSAAVSRRFSTLAQAAKRRAVRMVQERIKRART